MSAKVVIHRPEVLRNSVIGQKPRPALLHGMATQRRLKTFASQGGLPSLRRSKSWHENLFTLKQTQQSSDTASDSTTKLAQIQIEDLEARADTVKALIARLSALLLEEDVNFPKWIADWEIQHKQLEAEVEDISAQMKLQVTCMKAVHHRADEAQSSLHKQLCKYLDSRQKAQQRRASLENELEKAKDRLEAEESRNPSTPELLISLADHPSLEIGKATLEDAAALLEPPSNGKTGRSSGKPAAKKLWLENLEQFWVEERLQGLSREIETIHMDLHEALWNERWSSEQATKKIKRLQDKSIDLLAQQTALQSSVAASIAQAKTIVDQGHSHSAEFARYTSESRERVLPARRGLEESLSQLCDFSDVLQSMTSQAGDIKAQIHFNNLRQGVTHIAEAGSQFAMEKLATTKLAIPQALWRRAATTDTEAVSSEKVALNKLPMEEASQNEPSRAEQSVSDRHGLFARAKQLENELRAVQVDLRENLETLQARLKVLVFERERLRWNDKVFARRIGELEKGINHASVALTVIAQGIPQLAARKTE